ncbi:MAG: hypothetical protein QOD36_1267, partial [Mycobacterium sp.]|nr:hypothetical protein [Mycobacterium sp.]
QATDGRTVRRVGRRVHSVAGWFDRSRRRRRWGIDSTDAPLAGGETDKSANGVLELGSAGDKNAARVQHPSATEEVAGLGARRPEILNRNGNGIEFRLGVDGGNPAGIECLARKGRQVVGRWEDEVTARLLSSGQAPGAYMADPEPSQSSERRRGKSTAGIQAHALDAGQTVEPRRCNDAAHRLVGNWPRGTTHKRTIRRDHERIALMPAHDHIGRAAGIANANGARAVWSAGQQHAPSDRSAARGGDGHVGALRHLPVAGLPAQL